MPIGEIDVFKAALEWAKHVCYLSDLDENNRSNLKDQLGDCLQLIQFNDMKTELTLYIH